MLKDILDEIAAAPDSGQLKPLGRLLKQLRPIDRSRPETSEIQIEALMNRLAHSPEHLRGLRIYLAAMLSGRRQIHLYTDTGILSNEGLSSGIWRRINERLLPRIPDDDYLDEAFSRLIRRGKDAEWIEAVSDETWARLFAMLLPAEEDGDSGSHVRLEQLNALRVLAHRVCAMGLEPELVRNYPEVEDYESPFMALSSETDRFVRHQHALLTGLRDDGIDHRQIEVLMEQCRDVLRKVRRLAARQGASVSLTYLLVRISQSLDRMALLLAFLDADREQLPALLTRFLKLMSRSEARSHSTRALVSRNTELLARNITEHASVTGDHYVTTTRAGFFGMWVSASKAGVIVAFMALIKILSARLALAPLGQAFIYSMNYSFGFMLIHLLHGTIATKQPAMTASHIAASIEDAGDRRPERHLGKLAQLCIDVFRSQLIAILGNVCLAFPVALLIGLGLHALGSHPADADKANHLLHDLSPIHSLAIFHAAIAGVFLFLAGIISGYYDNKAIYSRIPERVAAHRLLRWLPDARRERLAGYLRRNLGALAGNFYFGIMLGSMGTIGFILGLPLDIRHITFAAANFAYALVALDFMISWQTWVITVLGVAAIGLTNLGVSFSLALMLALKSRGVRFRLWWPLLREILRQFRQRPRDFFWPPRQATEGAAH